MSTHADLAERVALSLIAADAKLFRDLALDLRFEPIRPIAVLALLPFLSAFVYESAKYIRRTGAATVRMPPHEEMLLASRMRFKLTEDKYRSSAEVLENAEELSAVNSGGFLEGHRGLLGPLKRLIQPDLGLLFLEDEVVCTTHVAFLNLGITKQDLSDSSLSLDTLGPHLWDTMTGVGEYVGLLLDRLGEDAQALSGASEARLEPMQYRDVKSLGFYESIASRVAPGHNGVSILMTQMLSQVNTARVLVPKLATRHKTAAFKIRFVSLFQTALGLRKLLDEERGAHFLQPDAIEVLGEMLASTYVRDVLEKRDLRNTLVHYGVGRRVASRLSLRLPLYGLVEAHAEGHTFTELSEKVEAGLDCISQGLRDLLPEIPTPQGTL